MRDCDAQSLSNLVWAFATVALHTPLVAAIGTQAQRLVHTFQAQETLAGERDKLIIYMIS